MVSYSSAFVLLLTVANLVIVEGHGFISQVAYKGNVAKIREGIPRSGNDGVCALPPGCEASFKCDWCILEKTPRFNGIPGSERMPNGGWWTQTPAAHWDDPSVEPKFPCMSKKEYGSNGVLKVVAGDSVKSTFFVNADHSGLYRFELATSQTPSNADYMANPITPWLALHQSVEVVPSLGADRAVGYTRAQTDDYFLRTKCVGRNCGAPTYRNAGNAKPEECAASGDASCDIVDDVRIPAGAKAGPAVLRWHWNSAEGTEIYANCIDLEIIAGGESTPPAPVTPATPPVAPVTPPAPAGCASDSESCAASKCCASAGKTCFEKDAYWASCLDSCAPGIHASDPAEFRTPWTCKILGGETKPAPQPSPVPVPAPSGGETAERLRSAFASLWALGRSLGLSDDQIRAACMQGREATSSEEVATADLLQ